MDPEIFVPIAGMATGALMVVAVARTIRYWIERHYEHKRRLTSGAESGDLTRIEERMAAFEEEVAGRVLDLEERMDFTERVLAQGRERQMLEGGDR
jgi:hypothetical protein